MSNHVHRLWLAVVFYCWMCPTSQECFSAEPLQEIRTDKSVTWSSNWWRQSRRSLRWNRTYAEKSQTHEIPTERQLCFNLKSHILCLFVCRWRDLKVMCRATSRQRRTRRRWRTSWRQRNANYSERWSFSHTAQNHFQTILPSRSNKITVKNQIRNINT